MNRMDYFDSSARFKSNDGSSKFDAVALNCVSRKHRFTNLLASRQRGVFLADVQIDVMQPGMTPVCDSHT